MKQNTIEVIFNKDFLEFSKGKKLVIKCDSKNTPLELRFRRLLKDSEIDNTVSILKPESKNKSVKSEPESTNK